MIDDSIGNSNSEDSGQQTPDRPDWLPEKFNTGEDLASSYSSLEKRLGSAPKTYDISKADGWVNAEDEGFRELLDLSKERSVPQEVMDKMLDVTSNYAQGESYDFAAEKEILGADAEQRLDVIQNWAKSNLSEDSFYALTGSITTAEGIKALEEIRGKMLSDTTTIPTDNDSSANVDSMEDLQNEINQNIDKYKTDSKYRNEISQRIERMEKMGYVDKTSA